MKVALMLLTYSDDPKGPRSYYAYRTLEAALDNISTSHDLLIHIADDGSHVGHIGTLASLLLARGLEYTISDANRGGYGRSYNLATQTCHHFADYVLPLEDDWELTKELKLDPLIDALEERPEFGCIRLGYLGSQKSLVGKIEYSAGQTFLHFLREHSQEPHIWTGHPRLESVAWQKKVGEWPEGIDPGSTELTVSNKPAARDGVLWPMDLVRGYGDLFAHIGTVQAPR